MNIIFGLARGLCEPLLVVEGRNLVQTLAEFASNGQVAAYLLGETIMAYESDATIITITERN